MAERDKISGAIQWSPLSVGQRRYGVNGRRNATSGAVSAKGREGYVQRDRQQALRKARMSAAQKAFGTGYPARGPRKV